MADLLGGFWSPFIAIVTLLSVIGCGVFLKSCSIRRAAPDERPETGEELGHRCAVLEPGMG